MIFGNPQEFAVEVYHEPQPNVRTVFGRIGLSICGKTFGDIHEPCCGVWGAISSLDEISRHLDSLWHEAFDGLSDNALFEYLDTAMFRDMGQTPGQMEKDWDTFVHCNFLTNWGESFDKAPKAFIVRPNPGRLRMIWRNEDDRVCALEFSESLFCKAADEVFQWHEQEVAKLPISRSES